MSPLEQTIFTAFLTGGGCSVILWIFQRIAQKHDEKKGKLFEIGKTLDELRKEISTLDKKQSAAEADRWRDEILRFDAELRRKEKHTEEEYISMAHTLDRYERYCASHPGYKNTMATVAIKNFMQTYEVRQHDRDYL